MIASRSSWRGGSGERARTVRYRVMDVQSCGTRTVLLVREPGATRSAVEVPPRPDPAAAFRSLAGLRRVMEVHIELGPEARDVVVGIGGRHRLVRRQISLPSALELAKAGVRTTVVWTAVTA